MVRTMLALLCLILSLAAEVSEACAERRVAFVIGNGAYQNATPLPNPKNDAEDVAAALERSGFQTLLGLNLNKTKMEDMMIRFAREARDADIAFFYYSGHALQFAGINYLMPVDANLKDEADLRRMSRVDEILNDLQQARNLRILVLDACRDNPLAEQLRRTIGLSRAASFQRGLAPISSPKGMIVAFSTQAGRTADDGKGRNSPYTTAFLRHIEEKDEIGSVFRRISEDVYESTDRKQLPELSLSLIGRFYLRGKSKLVSSEPARTLPPSPDERDWENIRDSRSTDVLEEFLKQHSDGLYAALARARLNALSEQSEAAVVTPEQSDKFKVPETTQLAPADIARELQRVLKGAGCYLGQIDGVWGTRSSKALLAFATQSKITLDSKQPTLDSLEQVRRHKTVECVRQHRIEIQPKTQMNQLTCCIKFIQKACRQSGGKGYLCGTSPVSECRKGVSNGIEYCGPLQASR